MTCIEKTQGNMSEMANERIIGYLSDIVKQRQGSKNVVEEEECDLHVLISSLFKNEITLRDLKIAEGLIYITNDFDPDVFNLLLKMLVSESRKQLKAKSDIIPEYVQCIKTFSMVLETANNLQAFSDQTFAQET
eukprot:UN26453